MAQIKATHTFQGMDKDTADRFMKPGMYRDALNVHIGSSEGDGMFSVENVKGNTLVSYILPAGTNQVIGSYEDIVNKCVYYFLCNSSTLNIQSTNGVTITTTTQHGLVLTDLVTISGDNVKSNILGNWIVKPTSTTTFDVLNPLTYVDPTYHTISLTGTSGAFGIVTKYQHSILKYDLIANNISLIYQHSRLNFNANNPITGVGLLNNVLHWTDDFYNPPRSLNLAQVSTYGTFFVEGMIDFVRIPPTRECIAVGSWVIRLPTGDSPISYLSDPTEPNSMNDKSYQFIYRYVYYDDTRSVWSPISTTVATGYILARNNKITITFSNEETSNFLYYSKVIKSIEIAFRDSLLTNFNYIDRVDFPTNTTIVHYNFYNDTAYSVVDSTDTSKYFESVPKITGSIGFVENRVFMGDCLEGFNVDSTTFSANSINYGGIFSNNIITWKFYSNYEIGIVFYDRAERKSGVYKLIKSSALRTTSNLRIPNFILSGIPPIGFTHYRIVRTTSLNKSWFIQGYCTPSSFKGQQTEIVFNGLNGNLFYVANVGDYIIALSGDPSNGFYPIPTPRKVIGSSVDPFGNPTIILDGHNTEFSQLGIFIKIEIYSPIQEISQLFYEIGERITIKDPNTNQRSFFINGSTSANIDLSNVVSGDIYIRRLDDCIVYHSRTQIYVYNTGSLKKITLGINNQNFTINTDSTPEAEVAQMFVDLINQSVFYQAFIMTGTQGSVNGINGVAGFIQFMVYDTRIGSQGSIVITTVTNPSVDGENIGISESSGANVSGASAQIVVDNDYVEGMFANDNDVIWNKNIGRPGIELTDGDQEERRTTLIRFGGEFLTDTKINNVNNFNFLDQEALTNFGNIRKLIVASNNQAEGTILLAVQENEISSLYIGQIVIKNAGGGQNITTTDSVIGTVNPLQKLVGTINPESVVQLNGIIYGFDALRGIAWRYGQDGLNFLSNEGMRNFFYIRSSYLLSLGSFKCYAGIDPYHNEYIISIPNTDNTQTTLAWSETLNKWTSFMSYIGEWYQKINTQMVSFKSGQLWLHRSNSLFNNFYGVQYTSRVQLICAQEPENTKILQIVQQKANGSQWDCIDISTPEGQSSELLGLFDIASPNTYPQDFRKYDNTTYVGAVLRDKNTPNMAASDYPLLRGDVIRDDVFSVLMENNNTNKQNLYFVDLLYIHSYKNP